VVIVFNVANVKSGSVQLEHLPCSEDEPSGAVSVSFSSVSPNRSFQKQLVLPHGIDAGKTVKDVQSKSLTIQFVKLDPDVEWGQAWLKPKGKSKRKGGQAPASPSAGPSSNPASPALTASKPIKGLDDMDDDLDMCQDTEEQERKELEEKQRIDLERKELQKKEQEKKEQERKEQEKKYQEKKQQEKKDQERKQQEKKEQERKQQEKKEQEKKQQEKKEQERKQQEKKQQEKNEQEKKEQQKKEQKQEQLRKEQVQAKEEQTLEEDDAEPKATGKAKARRGGKSKKKAEKEVEAPTLETKPQEEPTKKAPTRSARSRGPASKPSTSNDDKGFGLLPPSDPAIQTLVSDATAIWEKDPKKATVLLRLAGRKGYLPAYLLLAQLANSAKDDALLIETFCTMLTTPDAEKQMPQDLLSNCAMQLAAALRDPQNKAQADAHENELKQIASNWPIVNTVRIQDQSFEDVRKAVLQKQQELLELNSKTAQLESSKTNIEELRSKISSTQDKQLKQHEANAEFERIKSFMNSEAKSLSSGAEKGSWHDEGSSWRFAATVPSLLRLSDGKLDVSNSQVRLTGPDRSILVVASTPELLDATTAQATWSKKHQRLEVVYQKPAVDPSPQEDAFDEMD